MLVYLAIGALGFPVFAGGRAGLGSLAGPTGGYLAGFVVGAWATGLIARMKVTNRPSTRPGPRNQEFWLDFAAALLGGVAVVHALGSVWLAGSTGRTATEAFTLGSAPFILGDVLKALGAALAATKMRSAGRARWTWVEAEGSRTSAESR
jgi:biotin transport system substrate-specific component